MGCGSGLYRVRKDLVLIFMNKRQKGIHNPLYQMFLKIPPFGKLVIILVVLFFSALLRQFYFLIGERVPDIIANLIFLLYVAVFVNVLFYSILTSEIIQKDDMTKSHACIVVSIVSIVAVFLFSVSITLFNSFIERNELCTLLRHRDSPNQTYTVEVKGNRKSLYSGYDLEVYLIDNRTHDRKYVNELTDVRHVYINWTSETEFYIGMIDYEITNSGVTYQRHRN